MKKSNFIFLALLASFILFSCNQDEVNDDRSASVKEEFSANRFYGSKYAENMSTTRGIAQRTKLWYPHSTIKIKFVNGSSEYQEKVMTYAREWLQYAGLNFQFVTEGKAEVRIGFDWNDNRYITWSYIGTDCKMATNQDEATMSFADWDRASEFEKKGDVLRAFGQVLGLELESRHLDFDPNWSNTIADYWEGELTDIPWDNLKEYVFDPLQRSEVIMTDEYDELSIMIWPFTRRYAGNTARDFNYELSDMDKAFISQLYPKDQERETFIERIETSTTWTVPADVTSIDIFLVSGGGGGGGWSTWHQTAGGPGGGGGSLTRSEKLGNAIAVIPGDVATIIIGEGGEGGKGRGVGSAGSDGTHTTFTINDATYCTEAVGKGGAAAVFHLPDHSVIPSAAEGGNQNHNGINNNSTMDYDYDVPTTEIERYGHNGVYEFWEPNMPIHAAGANFSHHYVNKTDFEAGKGGSYSKRYVDGSIDHYSKGGTGGGGGSYGHYGEGYGMKGGNGVCVIRYKK
ncbi:MAG: hypothetical protein E6772_03095 [Dysgonomonas sp.]|nr:hypothetical protein [Dysgonomonas sp.]